MTTSVERYKQATSTKYSEDELAALPQTDKVFDRPAMDFQSHDWMQQNYMITDNCQPHRADCHNVGIPIPSGKTLIKKDGRYDLVDEL